MARITSPQEASIPGVQCDRCQRTFSVRIRYSITAGQSTTGSDLVAMVPLMVKILGVEMHECAPQINHLPPLDLWQG